MVINYLLVFALFVVVMFCSVLLLLYYAHFSPVSS